MHVPLCYCRDLEPVATKTRVTLVVHAREWEQSSNTGRVVMLALQDVQHVVWGARTRPEPDALVRAGERTVLLSADEQVPVLAPTDERPVRLWATDGTWRQTVRMNRRLAEAPGVELARVVGPRGRVLRRSPSPHHLNTGDAIVAALRHLGEDDAAEALRHTLRTMVDRALFVRGKLSAGQVFGGVSEAVRRALSRPSIGG